MAEIESINPSGLCQCGCGNPTSIAKQSLTRLGHIKGEPVRFIRGHMFKKNINGGHGINWKGGRKIHEYGYIEIYRPEHPNAHLSGYVFEHVLIASEALGKSIPDGAIVHHINGNPADNRNQNLVICDSRYYHRITHTRERALIECGNVNWRRCGYCGQWDDPDNLYISPNKMGMRHRACFNKYMREYQSIRKEKNDHNRTLSR